MFDIGFLEMMTIGIVALLVIGPERLPAVAAKIGGYVGKAQRFVRGVRSDISRELETGDLKKLLGDQKDQIDELRQMVSTATKDIQTSTKDTFKEVEKSIGGLKDSVSDAGGETRADTSQVVDDPELQSDAGVAEDVKLANSNDDASQQNNKAS